MHFEKRYYSPGLTRFISPDARTVKGPAGSTVTQTLDGNLVEHGQSLSRDPLTYLSTGAAATDPRFDLTNPYAYCNGNPIASTDPQGSAPDIYEIGFGAVVGGLEGGFSTYLSDPNNATFSSVRDAAIAGAVTGAVSASLSDYGALTAGAFELLGGTIGGVVSGGGTASNALGLGASGVEVVVGSAAVSAEPKSVALAEQAVMGLFFNGALDSATGVVGTELDKGASSQTSNNTTAAPTSSVTASSTPSDDASGTSSVQDTSTSDQVSTPACQCDLAGGSTSSGASTEDNGGPSQSGTTGVTSTGGEGSGGSGGEGSGGSSGGGDEGGGDEGGGDEGGGDEGGEF